MSLLGAALLAGSCVYFLRLGRPARSRPGAVSAA